MPRKISFVNYKGGVGKTSCIVNVAACMAEHGKRVLLVDLDAQSNTSVWLMHLDRWNRLNADGTGSLYSIFDPGIQRMSDIVVKDVVRDRKGHPGLPGLDLIPTTFNLIDVEHEYHPMDGRAPYDRFREQLAEIESDYDFIFFDCPPNVTRASQCGIFSSNEIIVPANPDALSLIGVTLLAGKVRQFNERSASFRASGMGPKAMITGVIFNAVKEDIDIEVPKKRMQFRIDQLREKDRVAKYAKIYKTMIRDAPVVQRAVTLGMPVCKLDSPGGPEPVLSDYRKLCNEILNHSIEDGPSIDRAAEIMRDLEM